MYICMYVVQLLTMAHMATGAFAYAFHNRPTARNMYQLLGEPEHHISSGRCWSHLRKQGSQLGKIISSKQCMGVYLDIPIAGWFIMENPDLKWMIWGYP